MNKGELISAIAERSNLTKADSERALKATIDAISDELVDGGMITLVGFGTFKTAKRGARNGRNPRTGEVIHIPSKNAVKFSAGKTLDESVNSKGGAKKPAKKR
jgi:DNA-binding protein HU-beta